MIAEQSTRKVIKELKDHGWTVLRDGKGSHALYGCPTGAHCCSVPVGHKTVSPGVLRDLRKAFGECDC